MDLTAAPTRRRAIATAFAGLGVCVALGADPANAKGDDIMATALTLQALAQLSGAPYVSYRNGALRDPSDIAAAAQEAGAAADWRVARVVDILSGWRAHHGLYTALRSEMDATDVVGEGRALTGVLGIWERWEMRAHDELGPEVLPLAWEGAFKLGDQSPDWRVAIHLSMISGAPDARSVQPLVHLIETTESSLIRDRAALALAKQPGSAVDAAIDASEARRQMVAEAMTTTRDFME